MPYLIDGHNLIHYLDDIELDDPNDEAKLVIKLRGFCAITRKKCVVIFDEGLPGGLSGLTTPSVKVVFASSRQSDADSIIRQRIRVTRDVKGWVVVSSDNEILDDARDVGMRGMKCVDFAEKLDRSRTPKLDRSINPNLVVSQAEVEEMLALFGVDDATDETDLELPDFDDERSDVVKPNQTAKQKKSADDSLPSKKSLKNAVERRKQKAADEVEHWLEVFGEDVEVEPTEKAPKIVPRGKKKRRTKPEQPGEATANEDLKESDSLLSQNTVEAWMDVFGVEDDEAPREPTDPSPHRFDPEKQGRYRNKDGKREPTVHKRMGTSEEIFLNEGEVDAWMDVFGASDEDEE